jgi:hypothetical protein
MVVAFIVHAHAGAIEDDRRRIYAHLTDVEASLRAEPPPGLTPAARSERLQLLDALHTYREQRDYPHNHEVPWTNPVFRDHRGRDCAVGALIRASGEGALADRIDARWHLARVPDIAEPDLVRWADAHGFTVPELARIQPGYSSDYYCYCEGDEAYAPVCGDDGITYWNACIAVEFAADCHGPIATTPGACGPYADERCPGFAETEPAPIVDRCLDSGESVCGATPNETTYDWEHWRDIQEEACLAESEAIPDPSVGCATGGGCGDPRTTTSLGVWVGLAVLGRLRRTRPSDERGPAAMTGR